MEGNSTPRCTTKSNQAMFDNTDDSVDANLLEAFTWNKKLEKEGLVNYDKKTRDGIVAQQQIELKGELERVKKRRSEREIEKQKREDEMNYLKHQKDDYDFDYWKSQEDEFHMNQARLRSKLRIIHRRAKPIDMLAAYISCEGDSLEFQLQEPCDLINSLPMDDCIDLKEDIKVFRKIEKDANSDFWNDVNVVLDERMKFQRKELEDEASEDQEQNSENERRQVIHSVAREDVVRILTGKSSQQLCAIAQQVEQKLSNKSGFVDVAFWECLQTELRVKLAHARLKEIHNDLMKKCLSVSDLEFTKDFTTDPKSIINASKTVAITADEATKLASSVVSNSFMKPLPEDADTSKISLETAIEMYDKGSYSPKRIPFSQVDKQLWRDTKEDLKILLQQREKVESESITLADRVSQKLYETEKNKTMEEDEEEFNQTVLLPRQDHNWYTKYKPRKPKFFNKVHTGYEWNKYNQTHYDSDNPPPKIVQGYKFNIFYPDLVDKFLTPEYTVTTCEDNKDFSELRFSAGPPYEDIAFKIINQEWDYANRQGFRCQFHKNVFQLWFHFKRHRYRR